MFQQLHPFLSSKSMMVAGKIFKGLLKTTIKLDLDGDDKSETTIKSDIPNISISDLPNDTDDYILVFDDFERSKIPVESLLGYINYFVELVGQRVIILGNDNEIKESEVFSKIKEKTIGAQYTIQQDLEGAFAAFLKEITDTKIVEFYKNVQEEIFEIYKKTESENLRHLRQSLRDFFRIYNSLEDGHKKINDLLKDIFFVYLVYFIEIKKNTISYKDIPVDAFLYFYKNPEGSPFEEILKKYDNILYSNILPNECWHNYFQNGVLNSSDINEALSNSKYYLEAKKPKWIKLYHYYKLEDDELDPTIDEVLKQLENNEYNDPFVILHIAGILLELSRRKIYSKSPQDIYKTFSKYIDEVEIDSEFLKQFSSFDINQEVSYASLGFYSKTIDEFVNLANDIKIKMNMENKSYIQKDLEKVLSYSDLDNLKTKLTSFTIENYGNKPILQYSETQKFYEKFNSCTNIEREKIISILNQRYSANNVKSYLKDEKPFFEELEDLLKKNKIEPNKISKILYERLNQLTQVILEKLS